MLVVRIPSECPCNRGLWSRAGSALSPIHSSSRVHEYTNAIVGASATCLPDTDPVNRFRTRAVTLCIYAHPLMGCEIGEPR
jgi:hypothetical protein